MASLAEPSPAQPIMGGAFDARRESRSEIFRASSASAAGVHWRPEGRASVPEVGRPPVLRGSSPEREQRDRLHHVDVNKWLSPSRVQLVSPPRIAEPHRESWAERGGGGRSRSPSPPSPYVPAAGALSGSSYKMAHLESPRGAERLPGASSSYARSTSAVLLESTVKAAAERVLSPRGLAFGERSSALDSKTMDAILNVRGSLGESATVHRRNDMLTRENDELRSDVLRWRARAEACEATSEAQRRRAAADQEGLTSTFQTAMQTEKHKYTIEREELTSTLKNEQEKAGVLAVTLQNERQRLETQAVDLSSRLKAQNAEVESLSATLHCERKRLGAELDSVTADRNNFRARAEELQSMLREEQQRLWAKVETLNANLRQEQAKAEMLNGDLTAEKSALDAERQRSAAEREGLTCNLKAEQERSEVIASGLQLERKRLQAENQDLLANMKAERAQAETLAADLQSERKRLSSELEVVTAERSSARHKVEELHVLLREESQRMQASIDALSVDLRQERAKVDSLASELQTEKARRAADVEALRAELQNERAKVQTLEVNLSSERQRLVAEMEGRAVDVKAEREKSEREQAALASHLREEFERRLADQKATLEQHAKNERELIERRRTEEVSRLQDEAAYQAADNKRRLEFETQDLERKLMAKNAEELEAFSKHCATKHSSEVQLLTWGFDSAVCALCRSWEHIALHMSDRLLQYSTEVLKTELIKVASDCGEQGRKAISDLRSSLLDTLARRKKDFRGPFYPSPACASPPQSARRSVSPCCQQRRRSRGLTPRP
eukprot:TRINITY_DN14141_c0_g1_i1.p1 TRINITY_DN14141_c0_g1~~TRINITY_DN14141_c0_g1_i1.p1  ORF type:complete len:792 (-),score=214.84 TRINITY_DN14141_c0_g1_i1:195-2570(-)